MMRFQIYRRFFRWRWRLRAGNGEIIAHGGQGYSRKIDAERAIDLVQGSAIAPIEEVR